MFWNFFKRIWSQQLDKAYADYNSSPGVAETLRVVKLLIRLKEHGQAFQYADNGYQRHPASNELLDLRQQTLKEMSRQECRDLSRAIATQPRPDVIAKLIEIKRSLGDFADCEKLTRKWRKQFADNWVLQFSIGKYLFQRSLVEKDPRISKRCVDQLEYAATLNPDNYKTHLYLATLLYQLGSLKKALSVVDDLLREHADDTRAQSLQECIRAALHAEVESRRLGSAASRISVRESDEDTSLQDEVLRSLAAVPAVYGVQILKRVGDQLEVTRSHYNGSGKFTFGDGDGSLGDLVHSLLVSSHRMGIGDLKTCVLEGKSWRILFRHHHHQSLLICAAPEFTDENFEKVAGTVSPEGVMA